MPAAGPFLAVAQDSAAADETKIALDVQSLIEFLRRRPKAAASPRRQDADADRESVGGSGVVERQNRSAIDNLSGYRLR